MNDVVLKDEEDLLLEKLISYDNYIKDKEGFLNILRHIYEKSFFLDLSCGMNIEDFAEEVITHNFNVCYEIALLYGEDKNLSADDLHNFAGEIYDDLFNCHMNDAFFGCILHAMNELKYSFSIVINIGEAIVFGNCQNTLLSGYTKETASIISDLGYMMFSKEDTIIIQKGGGAWESYQQNLIGKPQ